MSRNLYQKLFEELGDAAVVSAPPDWEILVANQSACELFGQEEEDLTGRSQLNFHLEEEVTKCRDHLRTCASGASLVKMESQVVGFGGDPVLVSMRTTPIELDGQVRLLSVYQRTDREKRAEQWLVQSAERFRTLAEMLPEIVYELDSEGRVIFVNNQVVEMAGYTEEEVAAGLKFVDFFIEEDRPMVEQDLSDLMQGKHIERRIYTAIRKDGVRAPVYGQATPILQQGSVVGVRGILVNITEQKRVEEALRQARDELELRVQERTRELKEVNEELLAENVERKRTEKELAKYRDHLEELVEDRTRELQDTQARLLELSRHTGMAEVATGVLHNVGNVLNSVNVAANLIRDSLRTSKVDGLGKAVQLMKQQGDNLGAFFSTDPRGRKLTDYLEQLGDHLSKDRSEILAKADDLHQKVEFINQIVAVQQSYAKVRGMTEKCHPVDIMEDAIQINAALLNRHNVTLKRSYLYTSSVMVERQKVLQVLVNLISNAAYALATTPSPDRVLSLFIEEMESGHVQFSVADNGIGVPEENLTRVFAHGFTTRKDGHGFGLHASAIAVKELGGSIGVESEGPGKGATFRFDIPKRPNPV